MILSKGYYGMHTDFTASCGPVCNTSSALVFHFHMGNNLEARWDVELLHIKHLRSRHFVFAPTTTSWRLDKQQVVLRIVSIRLHAEPHSLRHIIAVWKRTGGTCGECRNWTRVRQEKQAWHKEVHSCLCAAIKEGFVRLEDLDGGGLKR